MAVPMFKRSPFSSSNMLFIKELSMKKILVLLALVLVIILGIFVYAAANANSLIAKYKPDIEAQASKALGTKVTLGKLETSVFPGVKVRIGELILGDKAKEEGFTLRDLIVSVKLLPLLSGALEVQRLSIEKPTVVFIKDSSGISIAGLPRKSSDTSGTPPPPPTASSSAATPPTLPASLSFKLDEFELSDATVTLNDKVAKKEYTVSNLTVLTSVNFQDNLAALPSFLVKASLLGKAPLSVKGENITFSLKEGVLNAPLIEIDLLGNKIGVAATANTITGNAKAQLASKGINLQSFDPLFDVAPDLRQLALKGDILFDISAEIGKLLNASGTVTLAKIGATAAGIPVSDLDGTIRVSASSSEMSAASKDISLSLNGSPVTVAFNSVLEGTSNAVLKELTIKAFNGEIVANASADLGSSQRFSSEAHILELDIGAALSAVKPALSGMVTGTLESLSVRTEGTLGAALIPSLSGQGSVAVKKCTLRGVNLANEVLKGVTKLPFLAGSLRSIVPPSLEGTLNAENTAIESLTSTFTLGGGGLTTPDLKMLSTIFSLEAKGRVGMDSSLDLNSAIAFSKEFSAALAERNNNISKMYDEQERLTIPLVIKGTPPKVLILPDVERLVELAAKQAVKQKANEIIDNVLSGKSGGKKGIGKLLGF